MYLCSAFRKKRCEIRLRLSIERALCVRLALILSPTERGVAQLVAFLVWDQAVAGSSPVTSTTYIGKGR